MGIALRRDAGLRITVTPEVKERLERISFTLGVPPATLAALAVGQWVSQQERGLVLAESVVNATGNKLAEVLGDELMQQASLFNKETQGKPKRNKAIRPRGRPKTKV